MCEIMKAYMGVPRKMRESHWGTYFIWPLRWRGFLGGSRMSSNMVSLHFPEQERSLIFHCIERRFGFLWMIKTRGTFWGPQNTLNNDFNLIDYRISQCCLGSELCHKSVLFLNVFQKHKTMSRKMPVELIQSITFFVMCLTGDSLKSQ